MKSKKNMLFVLFAPCLVLVGFGYFFNIRDEARRFAFTTSQVSLAPVSSSERQRGFDTKIVFVANTKGEKPYWSTKQNLTPRVLGFGFTGRTDLFYKRAGKDIEFQWPKGVASRGLISPKYNEATRQYTFEYLLNVAAVPKSYGRLTCHVEPIVLLMIQDQRTVAKPFLSTRNSIIVRP